MIPALQGQARGNVRGRGFGAVILAGGSVHPKGSIFWGQMSGYQRMCRKGRICVDPLRQEVGLDDL